MNEQERPTAPACGDLSRLRPSASAAPASHVGYRGMPNIEERPCACGGVIVADPACPTSEVREHQHSLLHLRWRMRQ